MSCTKEIKTFKLEKYFDSGIYNRDNAEDIKGKVFYYQSALVSNIPKNQDQIKIIWLS